MIKKENVTNNFSLLTTCLALGILISKACMQYDLGFGIGDTIYYFTIIASFVAVIIYRLLIFKKQVKNRSLINIIFIILALYHIYILTLGEGIEGKGWV